MLDRSKCPRKREGDSDHSNVEPAWAKMVTGNARNQDSIYFHMTSAKWRTKICKKHVNSWDIATDDDIGLSPEDGESININRNGHPFWPEKNVRKTCGWDNRYPINPWAAHLWHCFTNMSSMTDFDIPMEIPSWNPYEVSSYPPHISMESYAPPIKTIITLW